MIAKRNKAKLQRIKKALDRFPSIVKKKEKAFQHKAKVLKAFKPFSKSLRKKISSLDKRQKQTFDNSGIKIRPWRLCPYGKHAVEEHSLHIEPTRNHPDGVTTRHYHCAFNNSHKDVLEPFEMKEIANQHFSALSGAPKADELGYGDLGNAYDSFIRGWTKYWNEVLKPIIPLDPNLVKALIATESGFKRESGIKPQKKAARGLMQLTRQTTEILRSEKGELKDHFVNLSESDVSDPNMTIAAGIRWLFRKNETASAKLKRNASWEETVAAYKSYPLNSKNQQMTKFLKLYERLRA
jgi:hypothetical protein